MTNTKATLILIPAFILIQILSYGQTSIKNRMSEVAKELITNLKKSDTVSIMNMYDSISSHINEKNYRDFIREDITRQCISYNMIVDKYGDPDLNNLYFLTDSTNGRNIAALPLIIKSDSALNIRQCNLYIVFNADEYFQYFNKLLKFTIVKESIVPPTIDYKITKPDINKIISEHRNKKQDKE